MSTNNIIEIQGLSKKYGNEVALHNVDLQIPEGAIVGLLGPNGSGKTTLIKVLTGFLKDYTGVVNIDGSGVGPKSKALISYLPDDMSFEPNTTVNQIVKYFEDMFLDFNVTKCMNLLRRFEIPMDKRYKALSKGMKEKVQLSLIMSRDSKILIFDEPIAGVDPAAREVILDTILENVTDGQTIILATHLIADIERIFDSVIFIKNGEIALYEDVDTIREERHTSIDELFKEMFKHSAW